MRLKPFDWSEKLQFQRGLMSESIPPLICRPYRGFFHCGVVPWAYAPANFWQTLRALQWHNMKATS